MSNAFPSDTDERVDVGETGELDGVRADGGGAAIDY